MKPTKNTLALRSETLRHLATGQLRRVAAGVLAPANPPDSAWHCPTLVACPPRTQDAVCVLDTSVITVCA